MSGYDGIERRKLTGDHEVLVASIRDVVEDVIKEVVKNELGGEFMVPNRVHYDDHEFVGSTRKNVAQAKTISVRVGVTAALGWAAYTLWGIG